LPSQRPLSQRSKTRPTPRPPSVGSRTAAAISLRIQVFKRNKRMCLAIPGKVVDTYHEHEVLMGKVDFGGVSKRVCLEHTPDVQLGQYVIVHVGFALEVVDEAEARQIFTFLEGMNELSELHTEDEA
jgi:hydrogenase expression/formation protein HypC